MANNPIADGLGAFALGTLGKAAGQDFLSPMLEDTRARDRLVFQQNLMQGAMDRERKREKGERLQSQRGLLNSLRAVGAFHETDYAAAGGVDELSSLDPSDFEVALSQMKENKLRSLSKEERRTVITGRAAAHGFTLAPGASDAALAEMEERISMADLDRADRKAQEKEARADAHMRLGTTQSTFNELLNDPTQVTEQTVMQLEGMLEADARYLGNLQGVDPDDLAVLTQQHQQNQRMAGRARTMAAASLVANGTRSEILTAWAENPEMRTALKSHEQVTDARRAVERGAEFILAVDDASAEFLGLTGLKKLVADAGGVTGILRNGPLAAQVAAETERIGDYGERLRQREANRTAEASAGKAASGLKAVLGDTLAGADPNAFVNNGVFDETAYASAALEPLIKAIPDMDSRQLRETQRRLQRTGLPMSMLAAPSALVDNRLSQLVDDYDPVAVVQEQAAADGLRYQAVAEAVKLSPLSVQSKKTYAPWEISTQQTGGYLTTQQYGVNPEWTGAMAQAFEGLDEELATRKNTLESELRTLQTGKLEFSEDSDERARFAGFEKAVAAPLARLETRINVREILAMQLQALPTGQDEETAGALFALGGGKDADVDGQKRIQAGLADGSANSVLMQLEQALRAGEKGMDDETKAALSEEITMLSEVTKKIVPMFEGDDADTVRRELKRQGILKSKDTQYPELEVLAYFLANR